MAQTLPIDLLAQVQACLSLANNPAHHSEATQAFTTLKQQLADEHPLASEALGLLWGEMLSARRSASFWEQISNVERQMSEQLAASYTQLQQNHLRLMQEQ